MNIKLIVISAIAGVVFLFGAYRYGRDTATDECQAAQATAVATAEDAARTLQEGYDAKALADAQAKAKQAEDAATVAQAAAATAKAKQASLTATLGALEKTDAKTKSWADERLPDSLLDSLHAGSKDGAASGSH